LLSDEFVFYSCLHCQIETVSSVVFNDRFLNKRKKLSVLIIELEANVVQLDE